MNSIADRCRSLWSAGLLCLLVGVASLIALGALSPHRASAGRFDAEPDLAVVLLGPESAAPGAAVTYTLGITNAGGALAPASRMTLTLPADLAELAASLPYSQSLPGVLAWPLGDFEAEASQWITLSARLPVTMPAGLDLPLALEAASQAEEPELDDNHAERSLRTAPTDLRVEIASEAQQVQPGELVTHTVTLYNVSRQPAEGLSVTLELSGAEWVADGAEQSQPPLLRSWGEAGPIWHLARVPGPWTVHIDLVSRVPQDAQPGSQVRHRVALQADTLDARSVDDRDTAPAIPVAKSDLYVDLSGPDRAAPDDGIEYSLRYGNRGPAELRDLVITDTLPAGVAFVSASPPATRVGARTLVWRRNRIQSGDEDLIRVQARLTGSLAAGVTLTNRAVIGRPEADLAPADNRDEHVLRVMAGAPASIELLATASSLPVDDGQSRVEARVRDAFGNLVEEPLEIRFSAGSGSFSPPTTLLAGGVATSTYHAGSQAGPVQLRAAQGSRQATTQLQLTPADLHLQGWLTGPRGPVATSQVLPGEVLTYSLGLSNLGPARARGLVLAAATDRRILAEGVEASRPVTVTELPEGLLEAPQPDYLSRAWELPALAAGERLTLTLRGRLDRVPDAPWTGFDPVFVRGAVTTTTAERGQPDLAHTDKADIHAADLFTAVDLNSLASSIRPGGHLVYDLTYGNLETAIVPDAVLTFTLPISTSFDHWMPLSGPDLEPLAGGFDGRGPSVTWSVEDSLPRSAGLRVWVDIHPAAPVERMLQAEVQLGSAVHDINPLNDRATDRGAWLEGVNLRTALAAPETVEAGASLTWRAEVHNAALRDSARDVVVLADPPDGLELIGSDPAATVGPEGRLRWVLESPLPAGATQVFEIEMRVPGDTLPGTSLRMKLSASSSGRDSDMGDNEVEDEVRVLPGPPATIELDLEQDSLEACGSAGIRVEARLRDANGHAVADGTEVRWSSNLGRFSAPLSSSLDGLATVTFRAGMQVGQTEILARVGQGDVQASRPVELRAGPPAALSVSANPAIVPNDGSSRISVQISDACANPVADGWPIQLSAERGRWSNASSQILLPSAGGRVQTQLKVGREAGPLRVVASHEDLRGETLLSVNALRRIYLPFAAQR